MERESGFMDVKQLKVLLKQMDELKTLHTSEEFNAGVDAAIGLVSGIVQEALDKEKMVKLEEELNLLRAKYQTPSVEAPQKRKRRTKAEIAAERQKANNSNQASLLESQ